MSSWQDDQVRAWWKRWLGDREEAARDLLLEHYLYIAEGATRRFLKMRRGQLETEDARAWGVMGLIRALEDFDPAKNDDFVGYAFQRVLWILSDCARREDWVPKRTRARIKRGELIVLNTQVSLDDTWDEVELVEDLDMGPEARYLLKLSDEEMREYASHLPDLDRAILEALFAGNLSRAEIARKHGKELVRRVLTEALEHIKETREDELP